MDLTLMILAAGKGSRYGGMKQLDRVGPSGETIMDYSVYDAIKAGFTKVVFVIRRSFEQEFMEAIVENLKDKIHVEVAFQELDYLPHEYYFAPEREKPWGTAHAIWVARQFVYEPFVVINADDFYGFSAFETLANYLKSNVSKDPDLYAMAGYSLEKTLSENGVVTRGVCTVTPNGFLDKVEENFAIHRIEDGTIVCTVDEKQVVLQPDDVVSMNFWGFSPSIFKHLEEKLLNFLKTNAMDLKAEYFIPKVVDELVSRGKVRVRVLPCDARWFGVTYREDKEGVEAEIKKLVERGDYPENLWAFRV